METIFHKIIKKEIPAYIIAEDETHLAILDIFPTHRGQTLILPKNPTTSRFSQTDTATLQQAIAFAQKVAKRIETKMPEVNRCVVGIEGFEVDYLHIKLYPMSAPVAHDQPAKASDADLLAIQQLLTQGN